MKLAGVEMPAPARKASSIAKFCVVIVPMIWWGFWLWFVPRCDCIICLGFLMVHDGKWYISMMLHDVIGKNVVYVDLIAIGMHKTGCSGETRLVLHVPSSS